jgi:hypothetical protein
MLQPSKFKNKWSVGAGIALSLSLAASAQAEPTPKPSAAGVTVTSASANPTAVAGQSLSSTQLSLLNLVYPPNSTPAGKPYRTHAANWEKWAYTQPADKSPLTDTTGKFCGQGQPNLLTGVWYLAGTFDAEGDPVPPLTRTCTIPQNRVVVFPVVNAAYGAFPDDPAEQRTISYVRDQVDDAFGQPTDLSASLDGVAINVPAYLVESDPTSLTLPANNVYGIPGPQPLSPYADKGYYIAFRLDPLTFLLGSTHTLKFKGTVGGQVVDVTYKLKVGLPG